MQESHYHTYQDHGHLHVREGTETWKGTLGSAKILFLSLDDGDRGVGLNHYLLTHVSVFVNSQTVCLCFMHFPVDTVFGQYQLSLKLRLTKTTVQERIKEKPTVR